MWVNDSVGAGNSTGLKIQVNPVLTVTATASSSSVVLGSSVELVGAVGGGTAPYTYLWELGGGQTNRSATTNITFVTVGNHTATLVVNDSVGESRTVQATVEVVNAQANKTQPIKAAGNSGLPWSTILLIGGLAGVIAIGIGVVVFRGRNQRLGGQERDTQDGSPDQETKDPESKP